ncbi:hypothetical protein DDE18_11085 [Nocardioides gansuensis]|uniref:DUF1468 domain-containing protein n=1 Tax=Nocardioides gansuensis TaxID=2138300 RepID=A0A2T8FBH3_9ACTN|nr:hypothetical protein DDE18_11085 [Nocardioides gansuensis]
MRPRSSADLIAGLVLAAFGLAFAVAALGYDRGSLLNMGPGYFPLVVAGILVALGVAIVVKAYVAPDLSHHDTPARSDGESRDEGLAFAAVLWRPIVATTAALVFFAFTVDGLGLVLATFGTALIVPFAAKEMTVARALVIAVGLTVVSLVIFVVLLQLRLALLGEWLGG